MGATQQLDLPGIPDMMEQENPQFNDEQEAAAESTDDGEFPEDESRYEKTYVAIDGLDCESLTDEQVDALEKEITNLLLLDFEFPITGVRVIDGEESYVIEHDNS